MDYHVYIIYSDSKGRYYIGFTGDLEQRIRAHNTGTTKSTRAGRPWRLIHTETFHTKAEAIKRENQIKSYKGGNAFRKLLQS